MTDNENKEKKIIVDEDWKAQAQKEKEELVDGSHEKLADDSQEKTQSQQQRGLPPADFTGLISMLSTQAFYALGLILAEGEEKREPDLQLAKFNIDMLDMLEKKTNGNLTEDEEKLLEDSLHQLRMIFVKLSE